MEPQSYQQQHEDDTTTNNNSSGGGGGGASSSSNSKSSFLCRQSSTRWIPTTDQIRILRDLYYNSGVRSPSAEQIQRISARLRQYGKIEGKNVFYWFQNHKARERQKKRLTVDIANNKYANTMPSPGVSTTCTSAAGLYGVGQMGSNGCGGSLLMERSYMECSTLSGGFGGGPVVEGNMGWVGVEPTTLMPPMYYNQQRQPAHCYYDQHQHQQQVQLEEGEAAEAEAAAAALREIETLPLFPVHSRHEQGDYDTNSHWVGKPHQPLHSHFPTYLDQQQQQQNYTTTNNDDDDDDDDVDISGASLELSLNSYAPPGST